MAYDTEIISILCSGMSFRRLLYPYMLSAALISIFSFLLSNYVILQANKKRFAFEEIYVQSNTYDYTKRNIHKQVEPGIFIYMENFSNFNNTGYKFSMEKYEGNILVSKLIADYIRWDSISNKWQLSNYYIRNIKGNKETILKGFKKDTVVKIDPKEFKRRDNFVEAMSIKELNDYIKVLKLQGADNLNIFIIEREKRLAYPFSTFILTMIGVTLSTRKARGGIGVHIGAGLTLSFAYILFMQFSSQFAISGGLSPTFAAWIPNIIFIFISMYLYWAAPK
jgi:lipopolysaccharide export system permease protein